jgi:ribonuclease/clavin/mitogillin
LIVTHLHRDHFLGVNALQKHLKEKFNLSVPIAAHRSTAESLKDEIAVEKFIEDEEIIELQTADEMFRLQALHTPGHARGHLCFYDEPRGFLLSGDNVVSTGSILIAPPEGNMRDYLNSLERMKNLSNLRFLCGAHGAAIFDAKGKIESYIAHRLEREKLILEATEKGITNVKEIVAEVYTDVPESLHRLAAMSVEAHLEKIEQDKNN